MISKKKILGYPIKVGVNSGLETDDTDSSALRWLSTWKPHEQVFDPAYGFPGLDLYYELINEQNFSPVLLMFQRKINRYCPRFAVKAVKVVRKKEDARPGYRRGVELYAHVAESKVAGRNIIQGIDLSEM